MIFDFTIGLPLAGLLTKNNFIDYFGSIAHHYNFSNTSLLLNIQNYDKELIVF